MRLQISLLDRLIDEMPEVSRDPPMTRTQEMIAIRNGFRRDLEALLNTRRMCRTPAAESALLAEAITSYGVEDFVGAPLATFEQRQELAAAVEKTIRTFEPRFTSVTVTMVKAREPHERRQTIRIEAIAKLEHGPEPVVFESALDPTTRSFRVD